MNVRAILARLGMGQPVLLYDFDERESEVDMVLPAGVVRTDHVTMLRREAGGLICFVTNRQVAANLGLPMLRELLLTSNYPSLKKMATKRMAYGDYSAFSIWVNSIAVKTGISDEDKAATIRRLHEVVVTHEQGKIKKARQMLANDFIAPGHVPVLVAKSLSERRGHAELSMALMRAAGLPPSVVICEMLDVGRSLPLEKAKEYALARDIPMVSGEEVVKLV
jgi:3,4-dihydroxy 2-butanone 4-phosphate synthase